VLYNWCDPFCDIRVPRLNLAQRAASYAIVFMASLMGCLDSFRSYSTCVPEMQKIEQGIYYTQKKLELQPPRDKNARDFLISHEKVTSMHW
jgi:hypothetical protein